MDVAELKRMSGQKIYDLFIEDKITREEAIIGLKGLSGGTPAVINRLLDAKFTRDITGVVEKAREAIHDTLNDRVMKQLNEISAWVISSHTANLIIICNQLWEAFNKTADERDKLAEMIHNLAVKMAETQKKDAGKLH